MPRLLSRADAATYCGVSTGQFTAYVAPLVKTVFVHHKRLYDRASIDEWIDGVTFGDAAQREPTDDELLERLG